MQISFLLFLQMLGNPSFFCQAVINFGERGTAGLDRTELGSCAAAKMARCGRGGWWKNEERVVASLKDKFQEL